MKLSDIVNVCGKFQMLRLFYHDLSGNPCSSQFYRVDQIPNDLMSLKVLGLASVPVCTIEVSLDVLGDPFHDFGS